MKIWVFIINVDLQAYGEPFDVDVEPSSSVYDLKIAAQQSAKNFLGHLNVMEFTVWKTKGKTIDLSNWNDIEVKDINFKDKNIIRPVLGHVKVENLELTDDEILLVRKETSTSRIFTAP